MRDQSDVISTAARGITKDLAGVYGVSNARMFRILDEHSPYKRAKVLIRAIGRFNVSGVRLIRADMDALFASILTTDADVTTAELQRKTFDAIQAIAENATPAVQKDKIRQTLVVWQKKLDELDQGNDIAKFRRKVR